MAETGREGASYRARGGREALVLTVILVLIGLALFSWNLVRFRDYAMDDAFITFRYAANLAHGHGLVFNSGETPRAEGITSPLFAALLAVPVLLGIDVLTVSKLIGVASILAAGVALFAIVRRLARATADLSGGAASVISGFAVLAFLTDPYVAGNAVSGMETALATLAALLFALQLLAVLTGKPHPRAMYSAGLLAALGLLVPLLRPEWTMFVVVTFISAWWLVPDRRRPVRFACIGFLCVGVAYYAGRVLYYGLPLPLPFYIKQGGLALRGLRDTALYLRHAFLLLPLVGLAILWIARSRRRSDARSRWAFPAILVVGMLVQGAYYVTLSQIMGMGFRFFQPLNALMVALAACGLIGAWSAVRGSGARPRCVVEAACALLLCAVVATSILAIALAKGIYAGKSAQAALRAIEIGRDLKLAAQGKPLTIAMNDCGAIPFYSELRVVDLAGLNNRNIALHRTSALDEIERAGASLVVLVSNCRDGLSSLKGYEELTSADVQGRGFAYRGSMLVTGTYYILLFGRNTPEVDGLVGRLAEKSLQLGPSSRTAPNSGPKLAIR